MTYNNEGRRISQSRQQNAAAVPPLQRPDPVDQSQSGAKMAPAPVLDIIDSIPATGVDDSLLNKALATPDVAVDSRATQRRVTPEQLSAIVKEVALKYSTSDEVAYIGICATLQAGGTNKNKRSNVKITIGGIGFESKIINGFITNHCKDVTPRQFARFLANDICKIAIRFNITGNAYVSLRRFYPDLLLKGRAQLPHNEQYNVSFTEQYWAADFQVDNPNCPDYIRGALRQRYADKFTKTITPVKNK